MQISERVFSSHPSQERTEIIVDHWLRTGSVPDQKQVSDAENLLLPTPIQNGALPLRILPLRKAAASVEGLGELLERHRRQKYLIQPRRKGRGRLPFTHRKVSVFRILWRQVMALVGKTRGPNGAGLPTCSFSVFPVDSRDAELATGLAIRL